MSQKWLLSALGLIVLIATGIAIGRRERTPQAKPAAAIEPSLPAEANFVGTVQPRTTVAVPAPTTGVLDSFFVEVGQPVYQDQLLGKLRNDQLDQAQKKSQAEQDQSQQRIANLNSELLAAKLEISRASAEQLRVRSEIERTEKEYTRQKKFWDQGITPRLTYEKAEQDYQAAKAAADKDDDAAARAKDRLTQLTADLDTANHAVAQTAQAADQSKAVTAGFELHSPADGLVVSRRGQPGDTIDPSVQDLFKIATDLTSLQVEASPGLELIARLHAGQQVSVRVPDVSPDEIPGVVREVRGPQVIIDFTSPAPITKLDLPAQVKIKF